MIRTVLPALLPARLHTTLRSLLLASLLWSMPAMVASIIGPQLMGGSVEAAEKKKTRRVPTIREITYKRLSEAQLMIDPEGMPVAEGEKRPEPKGTPQDAIEMLLRLKDRRGLNSYEKAQVWNTLAFAYYTIGDTPGTINAYEQVLVQGVITESLEQSCLQALYQLYFGEEQYARSIEYIERWETLKGAQDPGVTFIKATAYYQLKDWPKSLDAALLVEQLANQMQKTIKENWWYMQVVLYLELEETDNVIGVLEKLIINYPKKQYWMHLAGMYDWKGQDDKSLSAYHAAYTQGMLTKETELVMLSQRLLNAEVPYEAASILELGFDTDVIEKNEKNLKLLAMAYTMAQEMPKAIIAWRDATEFAEDGEIHFRLAQALANEDRYKESVLAYREALEDKDIKHVAEVQFWLAIALMNLEEWDDAMVAFKASEKSDKKKAKTVRQYIRYIRGEKRRQEELRKMLEL